VRADQAIRRIELGNLGVMAASGLKRLGLHGAKTVDPSLPGLSGAGTSVVASGIGMASVEIATTAYARGKEVLQHREASKDFRKAREEYVKQANGLAQAPEGDGDRRMALAQHAAAQLTDKAAALVESKKRMTSAPGVTSRGSGIARDIGLNAGALGPAAAHFTGEPFASVAWPVMSMISGSTQLPTRRSWTRRATSASLTTPSTVKEFPLTVTRSAEGATASTTSWTNFCRDCGADGKDGCCLDRADTSPPMRNAPTRPAPNTDSSDRRARVTGRCTAGRNPGFRRTCLRVSITSARSGQSPSAAPMLSTVPAKSKALKLGIEMVTTRLPTQRTSWSPLGSTRSVRGAKAQSDR
jgi:hypothetical protein